MTFLEKLEFLIKKKGLNRHTFAKECGIPYTTIDYWYKKNTEGVKLATLRQISEFFGVTLNYWKENTDDMLAEYSEFIEYLPYLSRAEDYQLKAIRDILKMPQEKKSGLSGETAVC